MSNNVNDPSVRFEMFWGINRKMGKPIPSTKPHIHIKVRDRYIYISTLEHPQLNLNIYKAQHSFLIRI